MKSLPIRLVVLLGVVSVVGIIGLQVYWVRKAFTNEERQLDRTLYIGLKNVAARLAAYRGATLAPGQSPVSQVSSNYFVVNVNDVIDANLLEFFLRQEFERLNLRLDYEYGIYDCATDRMVYGDYVSARGGRPAAPTARLPKYSRYTYYFGLYLPHRAPYLVGRLDGWLLTTALLAVVVVFFGYAVFVILRQKRLAEVQRDFVNAMSHELRTPITTIGLSAEVLAAPDIAAQPQRLLSYASIIREENRRLSQQVDKVLQTAKSEQRAFCLHRERLDLARVVAQVVEQFDMQGKHPAGRVELEVPPAPAAPVLADPVHLANVLFNLLDNAVKYAGDRPPQVRVALASDGPGRLRLSVADCGVGIATAHQARVFEKFFRVPAAAANLQTGAAGFGLGLYYVRNVVAAHGWKIALASRPGQGSTFTLSLPAAHA